MLGNRLPVGPGSRGGRWHDPEFRRAYHRAWRAAHPAYRAAERIRAILRRGGDPADTSHMPAALPLPAVACVCDCGCTEAVVARCGFCRDGLHQGSAA